jgi:hypothetical protein
MWRIAAGAAVVAGTVVAYVAARRSSSRRKAPETRQEDAPAVQTLRIRGGGEKVAASKLTAFSTILVKMAPLMATSVVISALQARFPWVPSAAGGLPFVVLSFKTITRDEPDCSVLAKAVKVVVMTSCWCGVGAFIVWAPLKLAIGAPLTAFHLLAACAPRPDPPQPACVGLEVASHVCPGRYVPFIAMASRPDATQPYGRVSSVLMHAFFDVPLVIAGYSLRELCGLRLFAPFATIVDDEVVIGSMPFPSDVRTLTAPPYDVVAVVNMTAEWPGPGWAAAGVTQLRLPTQDTCMPSEADLRAGAAFVAEALAANPGKRVYIHCKGGIGRAATMSLAHYVLNHAADPTDAVKMLKAKRPIIAEGVAEYPSVQALKKRS